MASYHRVLSIFDRSIHDKNKECDCDIHPWELLINNERWFGKIRLIGFVDAFFLICYSTQNRFKRGIIIYKEDDTIRSILEDANRTKDIEPIDDQVPPRYFKFVDEPGELDYRITSIGHIVDLRTDYSASDVKQYEIKMRRPRDLSLRGPIYRGITQHSVSDLMKDVVRLGIVSNAELTAKLINKFASGTQAEDAMRKWIMAISSGGNDGSNGVA